MTRRNWTGILILAMLASACLAAYLVALAVGVIHL
jgi:hypothetical protein